MDNLKLTASPLKHTTGTVKQTLQQRPAADILTAITTNKAYTSNYLVSSFQKGDTYP